MLESVLLLAAILFALIALGVLAAASLPRSTPAPRTAPAALQVRCPTSGTMSRIRIGIDVATRTLAVLGCERFEDGRVTCDRGCLPAEPLEAVA